MKILLVLRSLKCCIPLSKWCCWLNFFQNFWNEGISVSIPQNFMCKVIRRKFKYYCEKEHWWNLFTFSSQWTLLFHFFPPSVLSYIRYWHLLHGVKQKFYCEIHLQKLYPFNLCAYSSLEGASMSFYRNFDTYLSRHPWFIWM